MHFTDYQDDKAIFTKMRLGDVIACVECRDHEDGETAAVFITVEDADRIVRFLTEAIRNA